jgi:hypothetical protein
MGKQKRKADDSKKPAVAQKSDADCEPFVMQDETWPPFPVAGRAFAKGEVILAKAPLREVQSAENRPVNAACTKCHAPLTSLSENLALVTGNYETADVIACKLKDLPLLPVIGDVDDDDDEDFGRPPRCKESANGDFFCSEQCRSAVEDAGGRLLLAGTADEGHPCNQLQQMFCIDSIALTARHFAAAVAKAAAADPSGGSLERVVEEACAPLFDGLPENSEWWELNAQQPDSEAEDEDEDKDDDEDGEDAPPSVAQLEALARQSWELLLQGLAFNSAITTTASSKAKGKEGKGKGAGKGKGKGQEEKASGGLASVLPFELYAKVLASFEANSVDFELRPSPLVGYVRQLAGMDGGDADNDDHDDGGGSKKKKKQKTKKKAKAQISQATRDAALRVLGPALNAIGAIMEPAVCGDGDQCAEAREGGSSAFGFATPTSKCCGGTDAGCGVCGDDEGEEGEEEGEESDGEDGAPSFKHAMLAVLCANAAADYAKLPSASGDAAAAAAAGTTYAEDVNSDEFKALKLLSPEQAQATAVANLPAVLTGEEVAALRAFNVANTDRIEVNLKTGTDEWAVRYLQTDGLFRQHFSALADRLLARAVAADKENWKLLEGRDLSKLAIRCVEFHNILPGGSLADPKHIDTGSLLTLDVMLSEEGVDFEGAEFQTLESDGSFATHAFGGAGDAVLFMSHKYHCVRPLRKGLRNVLIIEFWEGEEKQCGHRCNTHWGGCGWEAGAAAKAAAAAKGKGAGKGKGKAEESESEEEDSDSSGGEEEMPDVTVEEIANDAEKIFPPGYVHAFVRCMVHSSPCFCFNRSPVVSNRCPPLPSAAAPQLLPHGVLPLGCAAVCGGRGRGGGSRRRRRDGRGRLQLRRDLRRAGRDSHSAGHRRHQQGGTAADGLSSTLNSQRVTGDPTPNSGPATFIVLIISPRIKNKAQRPKHQARVPLVAAC